MARAIDKRKWVHTSTLAAYIANGSMNRAKQSVTPQEINPYTTVSKGSGFSTKEVVQAAKAGGFPKEFKVVKRGSPEHLEILDAR